MRAMAAAGTGAAAREVTMIGKRIVLVGRVGEARCAALRPRAICAI
jgi:hypothetical protein